MISELIISTIESIYNSLLGTEPKFHNVERSIDISDVRPCDLLDFMNVNGIPLDADFDGYNNGYDGWEPQRLKLSWFAPEPTTKADHERYYKTIVNNRAFKAVYDVMLANGYKRIAVHSSQFKVFNDTSVYDMFVNNEHQRLVRYFTLYFDKK